MISPLLLLSFTPNTHALTRQEVLDTAQSMAGHTWTMGEANQTASCSSGYESDYEPGAQTVGIPYAWGGFDLPETFDARISAGEGAGSHSWHGVLSCVTGLDCSGFVSRAWGLTAKQSTSSMSSVSHNISIEALKPGDAFNKAGNHIVLLIAWTEGGEPVFQEAAGGASRVRTHEGWSYLNGYQPIRLNDIEEAPLLGSREAPIPIDGDSFQDARMPLGAEERGADLTPCAEEPAAPGTGQLIMKVDVAGPSTLTAAAPGALVRVLNAGGGCEAAGLDGASLEVDAGAWLVSLTGPQGQTLSSAVDRVPRVPPPPASEESAGCVSAPASAPRLSALTVLGLCLLRRRRHGISGAHRLP